ncbi:MAG TPA: ARC6/PARC6 family protein [Kamptonema sp.]|nr:ARC6/PARC6 family protein [Kamptonema sp.]
MKLRIFAIAALFTSLYSATPTQTVNSQLFQQEWSDNLSTTSQAKALILTQANTNSASLTLGQAADVINRWLEAKQKIFSPPFDRQTLANLTTGILYSDSLKAIDFLSDNNASYRYGVQKVESVERFAAAGNKATIEVRVTEDVTLYQKGKIENSSFNTKLVRYTLEYWDGVWKIADAKLID